MAQTVCSQVLSQAQDSFDAGHLYGIPASIKDCLDNGFTKQEQIQAYKLLTITYLFIDDPISAENSYLSLLRLDPEHQLNPQIDPVEIIYLDKNFKTTPNFTLHMVKAGVNFSNASVIHNNGVDNTAMSFEDYEPRAGFQVGAGVDLNFNQNFSLGLEILYARKSMAYSNKPFHVDEQKYTETHNMASVPIFLRYTLEKNKFYPFAYAGYNFNVMFDASLSITLDDVTPADPTDANANPSIEPVTGPDIKITRLRKFYNNSLVFGIGLKYRLKYEYISLDLRLNTGLTNMVVSDRQFDFVDGTNRDLNRELIFRYGAVADDFRWNDLSLSIGYVVPLYKPRKVTKRNLIERIRFLFEKQDDQ